MLGKRKICGLSLQMKMQLIRACDNNKDTTKAALCKQYCIPNSTLSTIIKNREKITYLYECSHYNPHRLRMIAPKFEKLEAVLLERIKDARSRNVPVTSGSVLKMAHEIGEEMEIEFSSHNGWLDRFKRRYCVVINHVPGEPRSYRQLAPRKILPWEPIPTLAATLETFQLQNIFHANETGFFYRCLPEKTFAFRDGLCASGQKSSQRLSVLFCSNADGSEKLPLFVIGKSNNLRCFKNVKHFPVQYMANKRALMTNELFRDWVRQLDEHFFREKRKVALVVENTPAHKDVPNLKAIQLLFFPTNTSPDTPQCGDQTILKNLRFNYRKLLVRDYLAALEEKQDFKVTVIDALHALRTAWSLVSPQTITKCFRYGGLVPNVERIVYDQEPESQPTMAKMFAQLSTLVNSSASVEDYLTVDENLWTTNLVATNSDVANSADDCEDEPIQDSDSLPVPTCEEMRQMLKSIRGFLTSRVSDNLAYKAVDDLLQTINSQTITTTLSQRRITNFFKKSSNQ